MYLVNGHPAGVKNRPPINRPPPHLGVYVI